MANDKIIVKGARENNLKNIDITLPKNKTFPPTQKPGQKFVMNDPTHNKSGGK